MSDAALQARVKELHDLMVNAEAASRPKQPVPPRTIEKIGADMTLAIMEVVRGGVTTHVVTANSKRAFKLLRDNPKWLRSHEKVMGEHISYAHVPETGKRQYRGIDSEQVAARVAVDQGWVRSVVRIAASRWLCVACVSFFQEVMGHVRLVNPDPKAPLALQRPQPRSQPPPVPAGARGRGGGPGPIPGVGGLTYTAGQRGAAGLVLLVQAANFLIGEYVSRREQARYREAVLAKESFISEFQHRHPTVGVLVIAYFEGAIFKPPLAFSFGMTEVQARSTIPPSVRSKATRPFVLWVAPLQPADVTSVRPPLPPVMLATFSRSQVFQKLEFRVADGFDDEGETDLGYPQRGKEARFWILRPPVRLGYYFAGDRGTKEIDIIRVPLGSGEIVDCVDLDPTALSFGNDCAFPAYPADIATDVAFMRVRGIGDKIHALSAYDFTHVRWIAPHRARSIGR